MGEDLEQSLDAWMKWMRENGRREDEPEGCQDCICSPTCADAYYAQEPKP